MQLFAQQTFRVLKALGLLFMLNTSSFLADPAREQKEAGLDAACEAARNCFMTCPSV